MTNPLFNISYIQSSLPPEGSIFVFYKHEREPPYPINTYDARITLHNNHIGVDYRDSTEQPVIELTSSGMILKDISVDGAEEIIDFVSSKMRVVNTVPYFTDSSSSVDHSSLFPPNANLRKSSETS